MQAETGGWLGRLRGVAWGWFAPRGRQVGGWAFILNRLSGIALTAYLLIHLMVLSLLAVGPDAYDTFVRIARSPAVLLFDLFLILLLVYHGLNGLRLILLGLGIGLRRQRELFWGLMALGAVVVAGSGYALFTHLL